jgi:hypothetical protein
VNRSVDHPGVRRSKELSHAQDRIANDPLVGLADDVVIDPGDWPRHQPHERLASLAIEPVGVEADGACRVELLEEEEESERGEAEETKGRDHVVGGVGNVVRFERQQRVQDAGEHPDQEAQRGEQTHGDQHVSGRLSGPDPGILAEEHVVGKLETGVEKCSR